MKEPFPGALLVEKNRPNVIILLTDDQGYGDLACHGNPELQTPGMDKLREESVRLDNFHVAPICTPTRSQLLTGCDALRNGAYSWAYGHECIFPEIPTMADIFRANGYQTGHFGKWHLGDNYPFRPHDRGFDASIHHKGAAITQTPDYWNNDYFDDHYWDKDEVRQFKGYCTDVWFREAIAFIEECREVSAPFFLYLPTNCPHGPHYVPDQYRELYRHLGHKLSSFFGMIANIDENITRLDEFLKENELKENTILMFMTDNGGTAGVEYYNAGMRGSKGTLFEGGHRVPSFIRWPKRNLNHGQDLKQVTQIQDILPTLMALCRLDAPEGFYCDGVDLTPILLGGESETLNERKLVVQFTRRPPVPQKHDACVIWQNWRLISGKELYDIGNDSAQENDISNEFPEIVAELKRHYEAWWQGIEPSIQRVNAFPVGGENTQVVDLCLFDWDDFEGEANNTSQRSVRQGARIFGDWHIQIEKSGKYAFEMRRWPSEAEAAIAGGVDEYHAEDDIFPEGTSLPITKALLVVQGKNREIAVGQNDATVSATLSLEKGKTTIRSVFCDQDDEVLCGVYYLRIRCL